MVNKWTRAQCKAHQVFSVPGSPQVPSPQGESAVAFGGDHPGPSQGGEIYFLGVLRVGDMPAQGPALDLVSPKPPQTQCLPSPEPSSATLSLISCGLISFPSPLFSLSSPIPAPLFPASSPIICIEPTIPIGGGMALNPQLCSETIFPPPSLHLVLIPCSRPPPASLPVCGILLRNRRCLPELHREPPTLPFQLEAPGAPVLFSSDEAGIG